MESKEWEDEEDKRGRKAWIVAAVRRRRVLRVSEKRSSEVVCKGEDG